ncbi:amino acid adenylation domain-containing protein [Alkalinema pantanalense CENA528]|uniref:non-ribosomal peptide synthetase n=1 Tax=Alkalinema pantanalense TaxID=1620705 RepID=UPI003D6E9589
MQDTRLNTLLHQLAHQGIKLSVVGELLQVDAPKGALTEELRRSLIQSKAELLALLQQHQANQLETDLPAIIPDPASRYEPFPLTDMQHAFWIGRSGILELGDVSNHGYYEIEGVGLDVQRLNCTLQQLTQRHDMLRAIVLPNGQQRILREVPEYTLQVTDLRQQEPATIATHLEQIRQEMSHQVLPADQWPLFDFRATCLAGDRVRLHISYDLLVFDAWSLFRLFEEWFQLYQNPVAQLTPLDLSFRDYVLAEQALPQTQLYQRSQDYWLKRLDTLPPAPNLPLAKHPKELKTHHCQRHHGCMEREDWQRLKQKATQAGLTPSGLLLAAFAEVIALWSHNPQFTLNLALFNRLPMHSQVNHLLGDFTSVTLLAIDQSQAMSFRDRAIRIQQQLWQDLEHRYFSGVRVTRELTRRRGAAPNAMPVIFTSTLGFAGLGQETLTFSHFGELVYGISQASQAWMDVQVWEEQDTLTFNWDVVEGLFPEGMIADMFAAYCQFLNQLANIEALWINPQRQLLPTNQLAQRAAINATEAPLFNGLLHDWFIQQACQQPDRSAVITPQKTLTYGEVYRRSRQLGQHLRKQGLQPNQLVGIVMEKGWEQIVAVLGTLISGAAYVPISPDLPTERLHYLLQHSEVRIVLTQSWIDSRIAWPVDIQRIRLDTEQGWSQDEIDSEAPVLESVQRPDDLAYVIYTSGSTGLPKGVMITHRNVTNVVVHTNQRFQVSHHDRILALTALNHDLSVYDIFGLLSAGGAIVMPEADRVKDPQHWAELLHREQVTLWNSVPPMMEMLLNTLDNQPPQTVSQLPSSLRLAILGGDWWPVSLPSRLRSQVPAIQLLSIGGPTETTIWNIGYEIQDIDPQWKSIPYGKPMANAKYYILNEALEDCPTWVAGQMYCAGIQLAKGYWRDADKTQAHFITHPRTGERLYRTGDRGRYLPDGTIEFLGRVDFQIKLRGHRIEAGEIEAALMQHPKVKAAIVKAISSAKNQSETTELSAASHSVNYSEIQLAAYIVPVTNSIASPITTPIINESIEVAKLETSTPEVPTVDELSQWLKQKLPDYMVPSVFMFLDALPLSANGKVDRQALPTQETLFHKREAIYTPPQNEIEQVIAQVFQTVLGCDRVGVNDNFFDIGVNSLLLTTIYSQLGSAIPDVMQTLSLVDLFSYPTVKVLSQRILQAQSQQNLHQQVKQFTDQPIEQVQNGSVQKLTQGKNRLKQRFEKSKLMQK